MTDASTFLTDFARGIAATAPLVEEDDSIEQHSVQSLPSLGFFQLNLAALESSRQARRPLGSSQTVTA